jgi:hypothetical protein
MACPLCQERAEDTWPTLTLECSMSLVQRGYATTYTTTTNFIKVDSDLASGNTMSTGI